MNGCPDTYKGSYYNNVSASGAGDARNIWPTDEDVSGYRAAFEELCAVMVHVRLPFSSCFACGLVGLIVGGRWADWWRARVTQSSRTLAGWIVR